MVSGHIFYFLITFLSKYFTRIFKDPRIKNGNLKRINIYMIYFLRAFNKDSVASTFKGPQELKNEEGYM